MVMLARHAAASVSADAVVSLTPFTVPIAVSVGDHVHLNGASSADRADNASLSTAPSRAVVISKPTTTTAMLLFFGVQTGFSGLTPGKTQFLGTNGGMTELPPTTVGSVIQMVGEAIDPTTLLFDPEPVIVL